MNNAYQELQNVFALSSRYQERLNDLAFDLTTLGKEDVAAVEALTIAQYRLTADPKVTDWLAEAHDNKAALSPLDQRNLELMTKQVVRDNALGEELSVRVAKMITEGEAAHGRHKKSGDWSIMRPYYQTAFDLAKEIGDIYADKLGFDSPYQARIDEFSPGLKIADIEAQFKKLDNVLPEIIQTAIDKQAAQAPAMALKGDFSVEKILDFSLIMSKAVGYDEARGKFRVGDSSAMFGSTSLYAPISIGIKQGDPFDALYSALHEAGHAIYEQNIPLAIDEQPVGSTFGMAIHESQSLLYERQLGKSTEFIEFISTKMQEFFGADISLEPENIRKHILKAAPSFIRVEADELTYPLHVTLRFELEKAIFDGALDLKDLPAVWNEGMQKRFGITPRNNAEGCMQDVHWPGVLQGYFPSYTIGAMLAAQFMHTAEKAYPAMRQGFIKGDIAPLTQWLKTNIHKKGSIFEAEPLIVDVTGEPLNSDYYIEGLKQRYTLDI